MKKLILSVFSLFAFTIAANANKLPSELLDSYSPSKEFSSNKPAEIKLPIDLNNQLSSSDKSFDQCIESHLYEYTVIAYEVEPLEDGGYLVTVTIETYQQLYIYIYDC